jgi:hypothetical protein
MCHKQPVYVLYLGSAGSDTEGDTLNNTWKLPYLPRRRMTQTQCIMFMEPNSPELLPAARQVPVRLLEAPSALAHWFGSTLHPHNWPPPSPFADELALHALPVLLPRVLVSALRFPAQFEPRLKIFLGPST